MSSRKNPDAVKKTVFFELCLTFPEFCFQTRRSLLPVFPRFIPEGCPYVVRRRKRMPRSFSSNILIPVKNSGTAYVFLFCCSESFSIGFVFGSVPIVRLADKCVFFVHFL